MRTFFAVLFLLCTISPVQAAESPEHWVEVRSPHFTVLTDSNEKQARRLASQFEQMRWVLHTLLPNATGDSDSPMIVLAVKDRKEFQTLEPVEYLAKGQLNLAGYFQRSPEKSFIVLRLDAEGAHPYETVYHEYTHAVMSKAVWIPVWMNEGMAEYYQNTEIQDKYVMLGEPSEDNILYLRSHALIPLTTLLAVDHNSPYYHDEQKGSVFYAESWALMHYIQITDFDTKKDRLTDYARLLIKGEDSVTAAEHAFGDLKVLQKSLESYVGQFQFKAFRMNAGATEDVASYTAQPVTLPQVNAVRAEVLVNTGRTKEAEALLESCLQADPNNAAAHETMGYLRFRAEDIPGAKKWYGEAVKLDSQSYLAHYYFATMSLQAGDVGHDDEIESSFQAAIKLKPEFAPSYDGLARLYARRHEKLDEAHILNMHAIQLEPQNVAYRANAASVLMEKQDYTNAVNVLQQAMKVAKTKEETAMLQTRIDQLNRYRSAVEQAKQQNATMEQAREGRVVELPPAGTRVLVYKTVDGKRVAMAEAAPAYPQGDAKGPHHTVKGVIQSVECSYPSVLAFHMAQGDKTITLYNNNFYKITFTTANYEPDGDIKPCTDIEGMKARVEYAEVPDAKVAGQIVSIELSK